MKIEARGIRLALGVVLCTAGCLTSCLTQAGEGYTRQGNALGEEIIKELVQRGYCTNPATCHDVLPIYGGHGDKVHFTCFGVAERNRQALSVVVELLVSRGISITSGTPIRFVAYDLTHEAYRNRGFFQSIRPVLTLEIEK